MKKIIKRKIRISTRTRDFVDYVNHEFYSHDKHNAFFEFTMEQLPTENIIGLFYFQKTKRYLEKRATVEGNTFTIEFDTSLITTDETVIGFIYFEKVVQSADVHQFSFGVKVSEIDKMQDVPIQEESSKRIVALEDIVTKAELKELFKTIEQNGGSTPIDTSNFATAKSVEAIEERVRTIENTEYAKKNEIPKINTENFATKQDLDKIRNHQPVADTSDLSRRISTLESRTDNFISGVSVNKESNNVTLTYTYVDGSSKNVSFTDSDTINLAYDDSSLREQLKNLENRPQIDLTKLVTKDELPNLIQHQSLTEYAKKTDIVTPELELRENILQIKGGNYVTLPIPNNTSSQLKGSGSPEGKVIANPGDTYVNTSVNLGDYLYYKVRNPGRNTGWSVLFGQMGVNINLYTGDKIRLDRTNYIINASINDMTINLDKLKEGNASDFAQTGKHVTIRFIPSKRFDARESVLPAGFRPNGNFQVPAYGSSGEEIGVFKFEKTYGVVKLILFNTNLADITQDKLRGINSGLIMYTTPEAWFTKLP
ncbi:MAG: hypothetical protein D8B48_08945 [Granulicatella sp.]|nr:MAG: hypothetical protein D8B48_08720 [Granulicatella sp.]RKW26517.1 MAG: hypothetical protein D8B48_08945 [Granulicatella sp.]